MVRARFDLQSAEIARPDSGCTALESSAPPSMVADETGEHVGCHGTWAM